MLCLSEGSSLCFGNDILTGFFPVGDIRKIKFLFRGGRIFFRLPFGLNDFSYF